MFTGIVSAVGAMQRAERTAGGLELTIASPYADLALGESVAVDGACLTVERQVGGDLMFHIIQTSLDRTRRASPPTSSRRHWNAPDSASTLPDRG